MKKNNLNIIQAYQELLENKTILPDRTQEKQIGLFYVLQQLLIERAYRKNFFLQFTKLAFRKKVLPKSVYLYGDVGRGKSMLMDLFFNSLPITQKARYHFHDFMRNNHDVLHQLRTNLPHNKKYKFHEKLYSLWIKKIAQQNILICLDELQITDITDAMIVGRLFEGLSNAGVTLVVTSNRAPDELYKNGLQRESFIPFIEFIKKKWDIFCLNALQDYRLNRLSHLQKTYYDILNDETSQELYHIFDDLTHSAQPQSIVINVKGRNIMLLRTAKKVLFVTFAELCEKPMGAGDYLVIASLFHYVIMENIPKFTREYRNEAKRFVTLIDILYEQRIKFICSAQCSPNELYNEGEGSFEFKRTVSRLYEMQSESLLGTILKINSF